MLKYFYLLLFASLKYYVSCQNFMKGTVSDSLHNNVPYCTTGLLNAVDSSVVKGSLTDEGGHFSFENIPKGSYLLKVNYVGYAETWAGPFQVDSASAIELAPIILKNKSVNLKEVGIVAMKAPIEFRNGNITVNIDGSPLAVGNSVYELLARLPGVSVENTNISIQGKSGALVYIDDRPQFLSGAQLINLLKSMNASSVEKIEMIRNPPAKYDAAGDAGIINIRTKKVRVVGFSGGLNLTYSQGFYGTSDGGLSLNYKGKKITFFSSFTGNQGVKHNVSTFDKTVTYNGQSTQLNQRVVNDFDLKSCVLDVGADWYPDKKNILGVKARILAGYGLNTDKGITGISDNSLGYSMLLLDKVLANDWLMLNYNVNAEHLFDTVGTKLKFSADYYSPNYDNYEGSFKNDFAADQGAAPPSQAFLNNNRLDLHLTTARLDFEKKLSKSLALEAGLKGSYQNIRSAYILKRKDPASGLLTPDPAFTNTFSYFERIGAAYASLSKEIKKFSFQLGLRGENTWVSTASTDNSISYTRRYFNLFPNLSASYNLNSNHVFSLTYNKRIGRPDYYVLNPYRSFVDILNFYQGNPDLSPMYSHELNFNYAIKSRIFNSVSYSRYLSPITGYYSQNDSTKETTQHITNFNYFEVLRYSFFIRQELKKWWTVSLNFGTYYVSYSGNMNGQSYSLSAVPHYEWINSMFILPKNLKLELTAFYWSPWIGIANTYKARWSVSLALKKSFLDNALNCSVALNDLFFTETYTNIADAQNQKWRRFDSNDTRRLNISLSYNFGKIKVQPRKTESDEGKGLKK